MNEGYDITVHLGSQVDIFLNAYATGNVETMVHATDNFRDICKNSNLSHVAKQLMEWEKERETELNKIHDENKHKTAEDILKTKNIDEYMITLSGVEKTLTPPLNKLETEYWNNIRELMLRSVKQDETL